MPLFSNKFIFLLIFTTLFLYCYHNGYTQNFQSNEIIERTGDGLQILLPASAYLYSHCIQDKTGKEQFIQSFLLNIASTLALKISINKKRPHGGSWSFPSAHTSVSFQAAAFIQKRYGWKYGIFSYLAALFVGYSRIYAEKHFIEDVAAGALLGIGFSYLLTKKYIIIEKNKFCLLYRVKL
jgi:hypothetical protein